MWEKNQIHNPKKNNTGLFQFKNKDKKQMKLYVLKSQAFIKFIKKLKSNNHSC